MHYPVRVKKEVSRLSWAASCLTCNASISFFSPSSASKETPTWGEDFSKSKLNHILYLRAGKKALRRIYCRLSSIRVDLRLFISNRDILIHVVPNSVITGLQAFANAPIISASYLSIFRDTRAAWYGDSLIASARIIRCSGLFTSRKTLALERIDRLKDLLTLSAISDLKT